MYKNTKKEIINNDDLVNVTILNDTVRITKLKYKNTEKRIQKIDKNHYIESKTGKKKEFKHIGNRLECLPSIKESIIRLRDILNSNLTDLKKCRFLTLTFKINASYKTSMKEGQKFLEKLEGKKLKKEFKYNNFEYILINEVQARNSFHLHIFLIFDVDNVKIPNYRLREIWGKGFTKIESIKEKDNIGEYFQYIFSSMTTGEIRKSGLRLKDLPNPIIKEFYGPRGGKYIKKVVKGLRLYLMKPYNHLYSTSKGIKQPIKKVINYSSALDEYTETNSKPIKESSFIVKDPNYFNKVTIETYKLKKDRES